MWSWLKRICGALLGWLRAPRRQSPPLQQAKWTEPHDEATAIQLYWQQTQTFVDHGQYERAVETLRRAIDLAPGHAYLHNALGQCLTRVGRSREAAIAFRVAASRALAQGQRDWARELVEIADALTDDVSLGNDAGTLPFITAPKNPPPLPGFEPAVEREGTGDVDNDMTVRSLPALDDPPPLPDAEPVTDRSPPMVYPEDFAVPATSTGEPLEAPEVIFVDDQPRQPPRRASSPKMPKAWQED